jgi:sulfate transport system substrate-binding protein
MQYLPSKNWIQATKRQALANLVQLGTQLKPPSTHHTSALVLAAGLGLSAVMPAYAVGTANQTAPPKQSTQLLSQNPKR